MSGPLADVKVLEIAQNLAIPVCGILLADMGAEVVKVEPTEGDAMRHIGPFANGDEGRRFIVANRGKRGLALDLDAPDAPVAISALARWADVVLLALKPGDAARFGVDYETLRALNPSLVYLEQVPMGPHGPLAQQGGYDVVVAGLSGLAALMAPVEGETPATIRPAVVDMSTGFLSALGVVAALRHRDRTGEGQRVETGLLATSLALALPLLNRFLADDPPREEALALELAEMRAAGAPFGEQQQRWFLRMLGATVSPPHFRYYRTADGFVSVGALSPGLMQRFLSLMEAPNGAGSEAVVAHIQRRVVLETTGHWLAVLAEARIPCASFNFPNEVWGDEHIAANHYLVDMEHPTGGRYTTVGPPIRMDRTPLGVTTTSPLLGEHSDEALAAAGLDDATIAALRRSGAVR